MLNKRLLIFLMLAAALAVPVQAQVNATPEQTLKSFYRWYIHELSANREPRDQKAKINSAITVRLRKWFLTRTGREWDADYFIDAQDFDPKWENGITTSKAVINGNKADVKVVLSSPDSTASGFSPHTLRIKMVKESNVWKIDHVNGY